MAAERLTEPVDLRGRLDKVLDGIQDDFLKAVVEDLFSMEKLKNGIAEVTCRGCGRHIKTTVQIASPDYRGIAAALATLLDQGKGKPKEAEPVVIDDAQIEAAVMRVLQKLPTSLLERATRNGD